MMNPTTEQAKVQGSTKSFDESSTTTSRLWHPFAEMWRIQHEKLVLVRGEGVWVWDDHGNRYLDGAGSLWYANVGHGRPEIAEAVAAQMRELETYTIFDDCANQPALDLVERLSKIAPVDDPRVFLTSGGSDAVDTAVKLSRSYWAALDRPGKTHVISRTNAYHGMHGFGTAIVGMEALKTGVGPLDPHTSQVQYDSLEDMENEIERVGPARIAAIFAEPVIGGGGVYHAPDGYLAGLAELCRKNEILLVADEVITGFGRLGHWFGCDRWGVRPDIVTFAKGITSGYLPLGGVLVDGRIAQPFFDEQPDSSMRRVFNHGLTFSGHAACCAAALANLQILEDEDLIARGAKLEQPLAQAMRSAASQSSLSGEVRAGIGLMAAINVEAEGIDETINIADEISRASRRRGLLVRPLRGMVVVSPPLTIDEEQIEFLGRELGEAMKEVEAALA